MWLSLLAVFSALVAPAAMLAEEVRNGGLCSAQARVASTAASGAEALPQAGSHCDWCASVGLAPPPLLSAMLPTASLSPVVPTAFPADRAASVLGLPFSRGPPAL